MGVGRHRRNISIGSTGAVRGARKINTVFLQILALIAPSDTDDIERVKASVDEAMDQTIPTFYTKVTVVGNLQG